MRRGFLTPAAEAPVRPSARLVYEAAQAGNAVKLRLLLALNSPVDFMGPVRLPLTLFIKPFLAFTFAFSLYPPSAT